jgi:hypothetical protein
MIVGLSEFNFGSKVLTTRTFLWYYQRQSSVFDKLRGAASMQPMQEVTPRRIMTLRLIILLALLGAGLVALLYVRLVYVPYMRDLHDDDGFGFADLNLHGIGTPGDPYLIYTAEDLKELADKVNVGSSYAGTFFTLMNDIELSEQWTPIGNRGMRFSGVFDGAGHTISGLHVNSASADGGLFGWLDNAEIYNLNITAGRITAFYNAGVLAGMQNGGKTIGCTVKTESLFSTQNIGGLVGWQSHNALIENCHAEITNEIIITTSTHFGGLVGLSEDSVIRGSSAVIDVSIWLKGGGGNIGGLVGLLAEGSQISTCRVLGDITIISLDENDWVRTGNSYTGGLAGISNGIINMSYAEVYITSDTAGAFGGFVGEQHAGEISDCFAIGSIDSQYSSAVGGFICRQRNGAVIRNSYCAVALSSGSNFTISQFSIIERSFFDSQINIRGWADYTHRGNSAAGEAVGKTTAEMQSAETFEGWDFITTWYIPTGGGYPRLIFVF